MARRLLSRLAQALAVLVLLSFAIYGLMGLMPGDPIDVMAAGSPHMTAADIARLRAQFQLDQPLALRYLHWLRAALAGDLGFSRLSGLPVLATLAAPLVNTLALMLTSLALSLALALPLGVAAALGRGRALDQALNLAAFASLSLPVFWVGLVLILLFAVGLDWLPASGVAEVGGGGLADRLRHLVLPAGALGLVGFGPYFRYMRAAMAGVLDEDWMRTARAKGLSRPQAALRHGLRNALVPVVTLLGLDLGTLFSGALVTEIVFAYPGMGKLIYDAVMGADYNLALAALLLAAATTLAGNLVADLAYGWLDPRVRFR